MKLFQFAQMIPVVPTFEWIRSIIQTWLRLLKFSQMFLIVCKFKWRGCILPKMEKKWCEVLQNWIKLFEVPKNA